MSRERHGVLHDQQVGALVSLELSHVNTCASGCASETRTYSTRQNRMTTSVG
jgi:hypothetical protein